MACICPNNKRMEFQLELGTGVFLSAIFLGLIGLYAATKDRWNWKKIALRLVGGFIASIAVIGIGIWAYSWFESRPVPQDELMGIKLGMTQQEVKYLKGEMQISPRNKDLWWLRDEEVAQPLTSVHFVDGVVAQVQAIKIAKESLPYVANVSSYSGSKDIEEKLGRPTKVLMSKDSLSKMMVYDNYRVWFSLSQEKMWAVGVFDPKKHTPGFAVEVASPPNASDQKPNSKLVYDANGWTQESTNSKEAGPWLNHSPPGTRYCRLLDRTIVRVYPPGVMPNADKANPFCVGNSAEHVPE